MGMENIKIHKEIVIQANGKMIDNMGMVLNIGQTGAILKDITTQEKSTVKVRKKFLDYHE